jgi:DNA-binding transcriptional ArsR family regulator
MNGFAALADPTRRGIVELLGTGERAAGEIAAEFAMTPPAVSQHLKVLREAGLVRVRAEGQRRIYSLDREGWEEVEEWMRKVGRYWKGRLDALESELSRAEGTEPETHERGRDE